ncbi:hypothetical protein H8M03_02555 [Sphingomonas sabuli]|uniref:Uncharacterized protein n=1 Tax=Sphingomonas sabuli TaxID=2764186 RepID=A0A7G9L3Q1_9SPHN|nr:hypothetical protein [Sphingomonas sabuli]QNM83250.1 hypothetical protein H8M03_02555 [Sphingomonas sabuli]
MLLLLAACDDRPRQWDLFIYPNAGDLTVHEELRGFTSFEHCKAAADYALKLRSPEGGGTFECGYMCRYDPGMQINVCKETRD